MPTGKSYSAPNGGQKGSGTQSPASGARKLHDVSTTRAGKPAGRSAPVKHGSRNVKLARTGKKGK